MTDKQIIIDGCDVSKCDQYISNYLDDDCIDIADFCGDYFKPCKAVDVEFCYYKQLKLKEQECEELKKVNEEKNELLAKLGCPTIATARMKVLCLQDQLKRAEQKLEKIKEIVNTHKQNRCKACSEFDNCFGHLYCDEVILKIIEE